MTEMNFGALIDQLGSKDDIIRKTALDTLMAMTEDKVGWIYDYLNAIVEKLKSDNSFQRNIGAMIIANLAKSDARGKLEAAISGFVAQMDDEKFITSRITLQAAWKYAVADERYAKPISVGLTAALTNNRHLSKHGNLIRLDAVNSLNKIARRFPAAVDTEAVQQTIGYSCDAKEAMKLIAALKSSV